MTVSEFVAAVVYSGKWHEVSSPRGSGWVADSELVLISVNCCDEEPLRYRVVVLTPVSRTMIF